MPEVDEFTTFAVAASPQLYRSAWLMCGDEQAAEDLVQETLAKVYLAWNRRHRPIEHPAAYARTTLVRTFISARRKRSSQEQPAATVPDGCWDDEDVALRVTLSSALDRLGRTDRTVLVLRYFDDLPVEQVAQLLDLSPGAVRNRSMRALAKLRDVLTPERLDESQGAPR